MSLHITIEGDEETVYQVVDFLKLVYRFYETRRYVTNPDYITSEIRFDCYIDHRKTVDDIDSAVITILVETEEGQERKKVLHGKAIKLNNGNWVICGKELSELPTIKEPVST